MDDPVGALHQEAIKVWLAVQSETRGIGVDGAGDLRAPLSHENFERFVYRHFPALLEALSRLRVRRHPSENERQSRAMTFDYATSDDFTTLLREAHDETDDAMNDLAEAMSALEATNAENRRLRMVIERDRSIVATAASGLDRAISNYSHLLEGRGSYEWDDDKWRDEFRDACAAIAAKAAPLHRIAADLSDGLDRTVDVMNARSFDGLREALILAEWGNYDVQVDLRSCPVCAGSERTGHTGDCKLAAALGQFSAQTQREGT